MFERGRFVPVTPGELRTDNRFVARHVVELRDHNGFQPLPLPPNPGGYRGSELVFVAVRIRSVYPGDKWEDTVISELRNR